VKLHWPSWPGAAQLVQEPSQLLLQQKPSTQLPEAHWSAAVQVPPSALTGAQLPDVQTSPWSQSIEVEHWVGQLTSAPLQTNGAQSPFSGAVPAGIGRHSPSMPAVSQRAQEPEQADSQQKPLTHEPVVQTEFFVQTWPCVRFWMQAPPSQTWPSMQSASDWQLPRH
jgi:hypothetical protein